MFIRKADGGRRSKAVRKTPGKVFAGSWDRDRVGRKARDGRGHEAIRVILVERDHRLKDVLLNIDFFWQIVFGGKELIEEDRIGHWFRLLAEKGIAGANFFVQNVGLAAMRSDTWTRSSGDRVRDPALGEAIDRVMQAYDPPEVAVRSARAEGRKIYLLVSLFQMEMVRRDYAFVNPFFATHPFFYCAARAGGYWRGIPSYSYPEARAHMVDLIRECGRYGADGIVLCTRSHSKWPWGWPGGQSAAALVDGDKARNALDAFPAGDEYGYGFDDPVVEEYRRRHGVDIREEPFDAEEWHRIKGEFFTQLLREARAAVPRDQELHLVTSPDRYSAIGQYHPSFERWPVRLYKDFETWKSERLLDGVILHFDRDNAGDLSPADAFRHLRGDGFSVRAWMHTYLGAAGLRSTEEIRAMACAVEQGPVDGVCWHEFAHVFPSASGSRYYRGGRVDPHALVGPPGGKKA